MRNLSKYLHNLSDLQSLDAVNAQINSAVSVVLAHAKRRDSAAINRINRKAALARALGNAAPRDKSADFSADDLAWFRKPVAADGSK